MKNSLMFEQNGIWKHCKELGELMSDIQKLKVVVH